MKRFVAASAAVLLLAPACAWKGASLTPSSGGQMAARAHSSYTVRVLKSLGGTNSAANTINQAGWAMGTSFLSGNATMHAALWRGGDVVDLKTLGGPNSAVEWPVESNRIVAGISETNANDPLGESKQWSCHAFLPDGGSSGKICVGFVWRDGAMHALGTLGGNNGYAAGANQTGTIAGWAETNKRDSTCIAPQKLQFLPVTWDAKSMKATALPTLTSGGKTDPDGAATAVNASGEVVGISGICGVAVGEFTAEHALVWVHGKVQQLKTLGGKSWNTPTAIDDAGAIVGFVNEPGKTDDKGGIAWNSVYWSDASAKPMKIGYLPGDNVSEPTAIDNEGDVVGVSFPSSHVYLWRKGKMTDVTKAALAIYPSVELTSVGGINDRGEIAGSGCMLVNGTCPTASSNPTFVTMLLEPAKH